MMREFEIHTLANGLTVLLQSRYSAPVATFWVWYRVGSRNEIPGLTGISHWVEHMMFKGTPTYPGKTLTRYVDRLGGRWNAFTWKDYTAYHEVLPAEHLHVVVGLEADRMRNTIFDASEVERERTVIISEREGSENFPSYLLYEEVDAAAFKTHPYRSPVIGWKSDLRSISRDDLFRHYRSHYAPNNAVIVAVGAFDVGRALDLIRESFESIPSAPIPPLRAVEPVQEGERRVMLQRPGGATAYLHVVHHVPEGAHADLPALLLLDGILSGFKGVVPFDQPQGSRSSRLYRALVETGLAADVSSSLIPSIDPTLWRLTATVRSGVDSRSVEDRALRELQRLGMEPVDVSELTKVKKQAKAQIVYSRDGVYRTAMGLGAFSIVDRPEAFGTLLDRLERVTPDDILRVATTYLHAKNRTTGTYLPEPGAVTAAPSAAAYQPSITSSNVSNHGVFWYAGRERAEARSTSLTAPHVPITPDSVTRTELHNGLVLLVREQPGSGMVALQGFIRAGAMYDAERSGLARFVTAMLQRGTRTRSSQEIAEAFEGMGAILSLRVDLETVGIGLRALKEDFNQAFEILGDVLTAPAFPPDEIERARGEILTGIRVGLQDTRHVAERTFRRLMFPPGHPHARVPDGDEDAVTVLGRPELEEYHLNYLRPESTVLAVVGDITAADTLSVVGEFLSGWRRRGVWSLPPIPPVPPAAGAVRRDARMSGKVQSDLIVGTPGVARTDPAYYETMAANLILGQIGLMGRLGESVRERQGMAYYAYSDLRAGLLSGPWWIRAGVNPANEDRALSSILDEVKRFQDDGPEPSELADAREYLVGSMAVRLETNGGIAQTLADIELYGLGLDYLQRYPGIIRTLGVADLKRAATGLSTRDYYAAIAGPPAGA
jgi:zinc protease